MSALSIQVPFPVFQDRDGQPLDNGYVWLGTVNLNPQTNPVVAYYDAALTLVAAQPLRTLNGYISRAGSPAQVYVDGNNFSILVQDSKGTMVYNFPQGTGIEPVPNNASGIVYDPAGTGAVATTVQTKLRESVSVKDFGAVGDGVTDDTAAIQAAINYCKTQNTGVQDTNNGGQATLFFPQGMFKVTSTLNCNVANGLWLQGDGIRTTTIVFVASADDLFSYSQYIDCKVSDMTLTTGTVSVVGGLPTVAVPVTRNNIAFRFNGNGGGTNFEFNNVAFWSFDKALNSTDNIVNVDNHVYNHCRFYNNNIVWNNTNPQAVVWAFNECKIFSTQQYVFKNAGGDLRVYGGDFINKGTFYYAELLNMGLDAHFQDVRFENYQNIDPTSTPKYIEIVSGTHYNIVFDHCTARGGGTLTGKTSGYLSGLFNVLVRDCAGFSGNWEIQASSSLSGIMSTLIFNGCDDSIVINQTLYPAQGNKPINLVFEKKKVITAFINRRFSGVVGSLQTAALAGGVQSDFMRFEGAINASTGTKSFPVFCLSPYQLAFAGADIVWTNNTTNTVVIDIYADSTKAVKLATVTTAAASGARQVISIAASSLLARHTITSVSDPMYLEFVAAGNAGTCAANINLNFVLA